MKTTISYSQNREDVILDAFFQDVENGFYVDVGANHAVVDSVTKLFYDKGWTGINIEPIPRLHKELCEKRPNDINLNIGVSDKNGVLVLREYKNSHGRSTFSNDTKKDYEYSTDFKGKEFIEYKVEVKNLQTVFSENQVDDIQFLKIDIEGFEYEALAGNDWDRFRPEVICIEADHITKNWRPVLIDNKYELVFNDGLNEYYVASEKPEVLERFSYVRNIVLKQKVIPYSIQKRIDKKLEQYKGKSDKQQVLIDSLQIKNFELRNSNTAINSQIEFLNRSINDSAHKEVSSIEHDRKKSFKNSTKKVALKALIFASNIVSSMATKIVNRLHL